MSTEARPEGAKLERTLHRDYYLSDGLFALERERIFFREWCCAGREEELPSPGDYLVCDVAGESVLVVRTRDGGARGTLQRLPPPRLPAGARRRARELQRRDSLPLSLLDLHPRGRAAHRPVPRGERRPGEGRPLPPPRRSGELGRLHLPASHARGSRSDRPHPSGAARRSARPPAPIPARRAAGRAADRVRGRRQLEGDAGELQRVLPLRAGAPGALPPGARLQAARRLRARLGARHPAP